MTSFGENIPQNPLKVGVNRQFQAKMLKYENLTISKTVNPIKPKFEDKAETTTCTSWVGYHYPKPNPTWVIAAILKIAMTSYSAADDPILMTFGMPMENGMLIAVKRSKSNTEVEFEYGGRLILETGSSNILDVD